MAFTTTQNYLGKCKECDYVIFATGEDVQDAESFREVTAGTGVYRVGNNGCFARCANRHKFFPCKVVKGTYSQDHQCDSRCLNAKGWDCICSCGGANHGRGHVATVTQASTLSTVRVHDPRDDRDHNVPVNRADFDVRAALAIQTEVARTTPAPILQHLGSPGLTIKGEVFVKTVKSLDNGSVLYSFRTTASGDIVKWFCPGYADPGFEVGSTHKIRAQVKSHGEFKGVPETIVTYVEEVE